MLEIWKYDKIWGKISIRVPTSFSGGLVSHFPVIYAHGDIQYLTYRIKMNLFTSSK